MAILLLLPRWIQSSAIVPTAKAPTIDVAKEGTKIPDTPKPTSQPVILPSSNRLKEYVTKATSLYGLDEETTQTIIRVIDCESDFNMKAVGKAGELGMAQFMTGTWQWFNKLRGTDLNILNGEDQADQIAWAFKNGFASHWTCYNNLY